LTTVGLGYSESSTLSLLRNLENVSDEEWLWKPSPDGRSIADIVEHVGAGKHLWANQLFGDASYALGRTPCAHPGRDREAMMDWLASGQEAFVAGISALSDEDAARPGPNGFVPVQLAWLCGAHDLYHAGELSHLRATQQGNDRWGHFPDRPNPTP
jgi:uncharacterized damage-inducible protein DinB